MKLSVIIVNYNVKYFLEQCLYSAGLASRVFKESFGSDSVEIIVVDNASNDRSVELVAEKYPNVRLIENKTNVGFSKANNQGIKESAGDYILLLNPDTVVSEDTFVKVVEFMDSHPEAGGLGVKMIDGTGRFLPESKRGFPSPEAAFYKLFGLSSLFPKSKRFSKYRLGYLDKDEINQVDVLSGAFMLLRKKTLDVSGLLDEDFFMYGEDIDLSYRIIKAGFKNYYFPETKIIHYKGESTKKGSLNYVYMFYNAMIIFAKKHFTSKNAGMYTYIIKSAIWLRAVVSIFKRLFDILFLPISDAVLFYIGFLILTPRWEAYRFNDVYYYPPEYLNFAVPSYILVWIGMISLSKGYHKPVYSGNLFKGILIGTFFILVIYSLLNEEYRYSRALLLLGSVWACLSSWFYRLMLRLLKLKRYSFKRSKNKKIAVFSASEYHRSVREIILNSGPYERKGFDFEFHPAVYDEKELYKLIDENSYDEVIFNYNDYTPGVIISLISKLTNTPPEFKTYIPKSNSIVGSSSIHSSGDIYVSDISKITKPSNIRIKRTGDIFLSLLFLIFFPIFVLPVDNKSGFLRNIFKVLAGKYSWVGYIETDNDEYQKRLPRIKKGILHPVLYSAEDEKDIFKVNAFYAGNYNLTDDIYVIYKSFYDIGNKKF